ncbi:unnamed protein product [Rotaria socialis]|uniref:ADP-ribosylhydrolase ARH3 n=2 Tax=Rotaria socialis TaxID=392032 RepID=A0A818W2I9_9BILA|nr:unnamed protein product [Rotaria socialis]
MSMAHMTERFIDAHQEPLQRLPSIEVYEIGPSIVIEEATRKLQRSINKIGDMTLAAKRFITYLDNGLTIDEATAIFLYTIKQEKVDQTVSFQLNRVLRSSQRNHLDSWLLYFQLFLSALKKLPSTKGTIWRCAPGKITPGYKSNCVWSGFSSCIGTWSVLAQLLDPSCDYTLFQIECINGKRIKNYSSRPENDEVILLPDTHLQFLGDKKLKHGWHVVYLQEMDSPYLQSAQPVESLLSTHQTIRTNQDFNSNTPQPNDQKVQALPYNTYNSTAIHPACQFRTEKPWFDLQYHRNSANSIMTPEHLRSILKNPSTYVDNLILGRVQGSMIGMALGDALGAHVEFRPRQYMIENPVRDLQGGGTWGLAKGQFTDDTSMALCLANSLVCRKDFVPYDQLVRYKWWYRHGYMSSTGRCFDIGAATSQSLHEFEYRQQIVARSDKIPIDQLDFLSDTQILSKFDVYCSKDGVAGNGALMRLAPVPLFFYKYPVQAVEFSGVSGKITHGDQKAYDACRYYGALIVAALNGETKKQLLHEDFYLRHEEWFNNKALHPEVMRIAKGSYKIKGGYNGGIRGKGYIINALEAALWAFWSDENSFKKGALNAVNLGDDTDTTAAIYGQLAGAYYTYENLPAEWIKHVYAHDFITCLSEWIVSEGQQWKPKSISQNIQPYQPNSYTNHLASCPQENTLNPVRNANEEDPQTSPFASDQAFSRRSQLPLQSEYYPKEHNMYGTGLATQTGINSKPTAAAVNSDYNDTQRSGFSSKQGSEYNASALNGEKRNGSHRGFRHILRKLRK